LGLFEGFPTKCYTFWLFRSHEAKVVRAHTVQHTTSLTLFKKTFQQGRHLGVVGAARVVWVRREAPTVDVPCTDGQHHAHVPPG
jgi:hypothetical protein